MFDLSASVVHNLLHTDGGDQERLPPAGPAPRLPCLPQGAQGKALHEGETVDTLHGMASYVYMANPEEGRRLLDQVAGLKKG